MTPPLASRAGTSSFRVFEIVVFTSFTAAVFTARAMGVCANLDSMFRQCCSVFSSPFNSLGPMRLVAMRMLRRSRSFIDFSSSRIL